MNCNFCGDEIKAGRGKMYVKLSGQVFYFCDSKCQKNFRMGRDGKKVTWTKKHAELKGK